MSVSRGRITVLRTILACAALFAGSEARCAQPSTAPSWSAACRVEGEAFEVRFTSASGDVYNDDMRVEVALASGATVPLPVEQAWYRSLPQIGLPDSLCTELLALPASGSRVLLVLPFDGRPSSESFSLVLLDLDTGAILDRREDIGQLKESALVTRSAGAGRIELRVVREVLKGAQCDCAEALIEGWRRVTYSGRRLRLDWE